jgi:hypothetical protein
VLRTYRQPSERQLAQPLAHPALVQLDGKPLRDPQLQIDPAPAHHTVPREFPTLLDPFSHQRLLVG